MVNPISRTSATQLPPINHPFVDENGMVDIAWYQTLLALFERTGGPSGTSSGSVQSVANEALAVAQSISALASAANTEAISALNLATFANDTAQTALTLAQDAATGGTTLSSTALLKTNNLSDLSDPLISRRNLHVNAMVLNFHFQGGVTTSQSVGFPLIRSVSSPASFAGTCTFCRTPPTADTIFEVNYWRGGLAYNIGTITLLAGTYMSARLAGPQINLLAGDVIELLAPAGADATLANVSISMTVNIL